MERAKYGGLMPSLVLRTRPTRHLHPFKAHHLSNTFVSRVIDAALREGWNPTTFGLDCRWLGAAACSHIIETLSSQAIATPQFPA